MPARRGVDPSDGHRFFDAWDQRGATHLRQSGPLVRCHGTKVDWEAQLLEAKSREQQAARWAVAEGYSVEPEEPEPDFRGMVRRLRQSPLRRATPGWAARGELGRQVADPMRDNTPKKHGVGYKAQWLAPFFQSRLGHWTCAAYGLMWWHRSITFPKDKSNNKEGCNAVRMVNAFSLDSVHSAECDRCRTLTRSLNQHCDNKLRCCQSPSFSLTCLPLGLVDTLQDDTGLPRQRDQLATMEIQGADGNILIRPGSGTAQGSEGAADAFHRVYHKRIDKWSGHLPAELLQEALIFKPPQTMCVSPRSPQSRFFFVESDGEQCCLGQCAGRDGTKHSEARTLCVLPGSTGPVARYLGPHLDIMGSIRPELERRRAAAFRTWTRFRPVWFRAGIPLRVRRLFFQALKVFILYTGLEALRLRPPDYEYLDRFVLGLGRKMMRGKATIRTKLEDGTEKSVQ